MVANRRGKYYVDINTGDIGGSFYSKIAIYFTLTRPAGVKILPKEVNSTRVPMDSERPKDSLSFCPAALYQLEAKWHRGAPPLMCVLGWGNKMCGRGLK